MKKKATTLYMDNQTQTELMKQLFIQVTHDNERPVIKEDFAEWLELEKAIFWVATTYFVWRSINNPSADECVEMFAENLGVLHGVFGTKLEVLSEMILADINKIREKGLRQVEEDQKGKILN